MTPEILRQLEPLLQSHLRRYEGLVLIAHHCHELMLWMPLQSDLAEALPSTAYHGPRLLRIPIVTARAVSNLAIDLVDHTHTATRIHWLPDLYAWTTPQGTPWDVASLDPLIERTLARWHMTTAVE